MSNIDPYLPVIGKKAIAWEQAIESGDIEQMLKVREDFEKFRDSLPEQLPQQSQSMMDDYDKILPSPKFPQYRP